MSKRESDFLPEILEGTLGNTKINRGMEETIEREPEYFWYYNNGVTIICDDARRKIKSRS